MFSVLFPLQVGKAMSSNESAAYEIMKSLDVDYVLIIFGGVIGYSGDDINKFLWMVRIAEGEHPKDIRVSGNLLCCWICIIKKKKNVVLGYSGFSSSCPKKIEWGQVVLFYFFNIFSSVQLIFTLRKKTTT